MRDDSDPFAELIELQPAWVKTFDLPGGDGAHWAILPNSDSVEIRAEVVQPTVNVWSFGVWYWPEALAVVLALLVLVTGRWWWFARKGKEPRCRKCRYELTNLKSDACPECGAVLTPRNRVIGMRSRWRMALAPVALLVIGSAWWFSESHVPRHGWVSKKVQWHWAVHRDSIGTKTLSHNMRRYWWLIFHQWYEVHGGERWARMTFVVANDSSSSTSMVQRGVWLYISKDLDVIDELRTWGRFVGSESIWEIDADRCTVTKYGSSGSDSFALPFCSEDVQVLHENRDLGADGNYLKVFSTDDELIASHQFLPDSTGDGWYFLTDGRLTHWSLATGHVTEVLQFERAHDSGNDPHWHMLSVPGGHRVVIYESFSEEAFLVDLESRQVIDRTERLVTVGDEGATLFAIGHADSPLRDEVIYMANEDQPILTQNYRYIIGRELTDSKEWQWRVGDLERGEWMYYLKFPEHQGELAQITTGPGPRDVNVFFIDGGQLILAVYELPKAE